MSTILVDADPIVYRCGFVGQTTALQTQLSNDTQEMCKIFGSKKEAKEWAKEHKWNIDGYDEFVYDVEPIAHVLHSVKMQMQLCADQADTCKVFISGKGNFRKHVATILPYKGNRSDRKPELYKEIRQYLADVWDAQFVDGHEVDDEISILARESGYKAIVASIDKDLDQIPGKHFDYARRLVYTIGEGEAERFFWKQVIMGDMTDNIQGAYKVGEAKAEAYLAEEHSPWDAVMEAYHWSMERYPDRYPEGMSTYAVALENARLVKMLEYRGQLWTPSE